MITRFFLKKKNTRCKERAYFLSVRYAMSPIFQKAPLNDHLIPLRPPQCEDRLQPKCEEHKYSIRNVVCVCVCVEKGKENPTFEK